MFPDVKRRTLSRGEKFMMRRLLMTASVALACATVAQPVDAQISFGGQAALMTGLEELQAGDNNGTFGIGPRVQLSPPLPMLALGIVGQGVYYFPEDGGYMTFGLSGKLGFSLPMISPYLIGGWQWRRTSPDVGDAVTENGPSVGLGVQLGMIPVFVEATMEFNDELTGFPGAEDIDVNPLVLQAGVLVGG
jgi:hypothetical protein